MLCSFYVVNIQSNLAHLKGLLNVQILKNILYFLNAVIDLVFATLAAFL